MEESKNGAFNRFLNFFTSAPLLVSQKAEDDARGLKVLFSMSTKDETKNLIFFF